MNLAKCHVLKGSLERKLAIAIEALESNTGGDLNSGEGIYKAEIAREALDKIHGD